ncbi:retrovirus-related pol polyprotein from transposon TNT 1-94 [Tanacetum coccineum]
MSTSTTHQQSLVNAGSETRPLMLERCSYIPWASHFRRAKKLEKSHDPLALVAHTGSSSRIPSPYYVTHPSLVVDYDDDYLGDAFQNNFEDLLVSAMIRNSSNDGRNTRRSYVQEEIIEGNNVQNDAGNTQRTLRTTSSGSAANVQCYNCSEKGHYARNCPKPKVRDSKYFMEQMLLAKQDETGVTLTDEQNDFLVADATRMEEIEELSVYICLMAKIQPANIDSDVGPSYDFVFLGEVQTPSTSYVNPLFAKDNQEQKYPKQPKIINDTIGDYQIDSNIIFDEPNVDVNNGSVEYDNNVQELYELDQLARNAYKEAEKQKINANKVTQQNKVLTQLLELYKEKVRVFEMTKGDNATFLNEFIEADSKAKRPKVASSVRRPSNRDSPFKNSVLSNIKKSSENVEVSVRTNKKTYVASKNVISDKKIVIDVDVKNALKANDVLCVSCSMNVLIPCHDKCLANYKFNAHLKVRRALFTNPRIAKSMFEDTTPVIVDSGCLMHMTGDRSLLKFFVKKFMGTVRFGNDYFAAFIGYGNYVQDNITVCHVYYVEGDDLLIRARESNLYTISISDMAASSPVCLMSKATSTKSWLWHHRLSHLNFGTINDLTKHNLVDGLLKFKYSKDHLCSACERGKRKKSSHQPKLVPNTHSKLELLHMDLCGPMKVETINEKKYILVIVDDYSRFIWVYFLHTKYETPKIIKKFIAQVQLNYNDKVHKIQTDNNTEFKNRTLKAYYEKLGIMQQFSISQTPPQNGVVERRNRTLVKAVRTMLIFSRLL